MRIALLLLQSYGSVSVRGEIPVHVGTVWVLKHNPVGGVACYLNGLRQQAGKDFRLSENKMTSDYWGAQDEKDIVCDYSYTAMPLPGVQDL